MAALVHAAGSPHRRRALAEALRHDALSAGKIVALALRDTEVNVAHRATEHILLQTVPAVDQPVAASAQRMIDRLLTARVPRSARPQSRCCAVPSARTWPPPSYWTARP